MSQGRSITTVLGKAGSGKTELIRKCLPECVSPVLILDTMDEFWTEGVVFHKTATLAHFLSERRPNVTGVYIVKADSDAKCEDFFRFMTDGLGKSQIPCTVVLDEADKFCTPYKINPALEQSLKYGRHWNHSLIFAARRAAEINRNVTAQSDIIVSFQQTEPGDIRALKSIYAGAENLSDLDPNRFEYMVFGNANAVPFHSILTNGRLIEPNVDGKIDVDFPDGNEPEPEQDFNEEQSEGEKSE